MSGSCKSDFKKDLWKISWAYAIPKMANTDSFFFKNVMPVNHIQGQKKSTWPPE